jgi:pyruvate/2-oxoglutarate dehydrogenase complex dihydrolipoamide dehydrogenase (E3) component
VKAASYDAIVIGTGQSGPYVTSRLAAAGMKVAVIERKVFGGTRSSSTRASRFA